MMEGGTFCAGATQMATRLLGHRVLDRERDIFLTTIRQIFILKLKKMAEVGVFYFS